MHYQQLIPMIDESICCDVNNDGEIPSTFNTSELKSLVDAVRVVQSGQRSYQIFSLNNE